MTTNPTPLTIGLVIDDSLDRPDGVQQHVLTLGRWLTGKGHTVHYLTSTTQRTDIPRIHSLAKNLPITFNGNRLGIPLPADRSAIRQLFTDVHFDVLHINMPYSPCSPVPSSTPHQPPHALWERSTSCRGQPSPR